MENFITRIGETIVTILLELYAKLPSRVDSRTDVAPIFRAISRGKEKKKKDRSKEKLWLNLFSEELSGKRFRAGSKWVKDHVPFEVRNLELNRTGISELGLEFRSWELVNRGILALNIYSELKLINSIFF